MASPGDAHEDGGEVFPSLTGSGAVPRCILDVVL